MGGAPKEVIELIERFERNIESYKGQGYNEAQVRKEFIDPFFDALGWDVANKGGIAEAYKYVINEDAIKIGGETKAPDYCFRIGGTRKFFLEAKKPAIDIGDSEESAYQLRRYAWSAKLPLSILTNFEKFAVYDCLVRPQHTERANTARTIYMTYKDYVERWDEISAIFSKEAVLKGSFDKYAAKAEGKRGTSTVDKEFLKEIEGWRKNLAIYIARQNRNLGATEVSFAVQKTIDRILFLRMCEGWGIESYGQLMALKNGKDIYRRLGELFEKADAKYNSGLFYFKQEKGRNEPPDELTLGLDVPDEPISWILNNLYYPQPYDFRVFPAEILGNVYEQFLGKVIRITPARMVKIEDKPEVKKAGGVYYTPEYIVNYIVKNTVGKLCEDKTPKEISKLKILDPACGSGSFLLEAYTYLLNYHRDWYVNDGPEKHKEHIYQGRGGQWYLTIKEKKQILLNNIYGVDIDFQAVEVTKLSLLLKVLAGENQETVGSQFRISHERALPDLGDNIKCGNSLIGTDLYQMPEADKITEDERRRVNAFDWESGFQNVFKQGGFDAVIGNPPYIQLSMADYYDKDSNAYYVKNYSSSMGRLNTFGLFIERGLKVFLNQNGHLSFIVPNTLLTQEYYQALRKEILNYSLTNLTIYKYPVFPNAVVETIVFVIKKASADKNIVEIVEYDNKTMKHQVRKTQQETYLHSHNNSFLVKVDSGSLNLKAKLDAIGVPLKKITNINQAIALKSDRSLSLFKERKKENFKPVLDGRNIQRYSLKWNGVYLAYDVRKIHSCKRTDIFEAKEKIFFRRVGSGLVATYDDSQYYALNTLVVVTLFPESNLSIKYLLALLNSKLLNFYYVTYLKSTKKVFSEIQARQFAQLPIRTIDFDKPAEETKHNKMVKLVERMLELNKKAALAKVPTEKERLQREIGATDKQIDKLVYELYGLTSDEIAIVEGN